MIRRLAGSALVALMLLGGLPAAGDPTTRIEATTAAEEATAGSLAAMLRLMPALPLGGEAGATVTYVDVATQLAAVGVAPPQSGDEASSAHIQATGWLKRLRWMGYSFEPEWRQMFGFGLYGIDQAIEYEARPFYMTIYRGRFSVSAVLRAWEEEGYRPIEGREGMVYEDLDIRLNPPGLDLALSNMNYAAIFGEGTVAFASEGDVLRSALAAIVGDAPSFADGASVAPLLAKLPSEPGLGDDRRRRRSWPTLPRSPSRRRSRRGGCPRSSPRCSGSPPALPLSKRSESRSSCRPASPPHDPSSP